MRKRSRLAHLNAGDHALRFSYAAPTYAPAYRGSPETRYRTRLEGLDAGWSEWSPASHRDFTSLPYRKFVFHVQARDFTGRTGGETRVAFAIAAPWWLTRWALGGYGILGLGAFAGVFVLRTRELRRRAERLEKVVASRTRELRERNRGLARLHRLELHEKVSARLAEEKARLEVLRYQLNPHFLFTPSTRSARKSSVNPRSPAPWSCASRNFFALRCTGPLRTNRR